MSETVIVALATFFATVGPFDMALLFAVLSSHLSQAEKAQAALRGILIGSVILLLFAFVGEFLLHSLGISLAALKAAGGILLLLLGIQMVFSPSSAGIPGQGADDVAGQKTAVDYPDIAVFPLATPLIAGPGTMGAVIVLMADQQGQLLGQLEVLLSLIAILLLTYINLRIASLIQKKIGIITTHVITRIMGVLLVALAVQFIFDGVKSSGMFG